MQKKEEKRGVPNKLGQLVNLHFKTFIGKLIGPYTFSTMTLILHSSVRYLQLLKTRAIKLTLKKTLKLL